MTLHKPWINHLCGSGFRKRFSRVLGWASSDPTNATSRLMKQFGNHAWIQLWRGRTWSSFDNVHGSWSTFGNGQGNLTAREVHRDQHSLRCENNSRRIEPLQPHHGSSYYNAIWLYQAAWSWTAWYRFRSDLGEEFDKSEDGFRLEVYRIRLSVAQSFVSIW